MTNSSETKQPKPTFPGQVVKVIDPNRLAINRGSRHGVKVGQHFVFYDQCSEELTDPETGESLGRLELVKASGKVEHVQERMSLIRAEKGIGSIWTAQLLGLGAALTQDRDALAQYLPFQNVKRGDLAKPV